MVYVRGGGGAGIETSDRAESENEFPLLSLLFLLSLLSLLSLSLSLSGHELPEGLLADGPDDALGSLELGPQVEVGLGLVVGYGFGVVLHFGRGRKGGRGKGRYMAREGERDGA